MSELIEQIIPPFPSLTSRAVRSSAVVFVAKTVRYSFVFFIQLVLLNLLPPSDFGLLRYITIILGIVNLLNELGLTTAIIQKKDLRPDELSAALGINILFGIAVYCVVFICAPVLALYFNSPRLINLIRIGALAVPCASLAVVPLARMQREFHYVKISVIEVVSAVVGSITALVMAFAGCGVWSLIASLLCFYAISSVLYMVLGVLPKDNMFRISAGRGLLFFGSGVVLQRIFDYIWTNFDYIVIGKYFGEKALGLYGIAYDVVSLPKIAVGVVISSIALSAFSRVQEDSARLIAGFLKITLCMTILVVPFLAITCSMPRELMFAVSFINHKPTWVEAAAPLRVLSMVALMYALASYPSSVWIAKGRVRLNAVWAGIMLCTVVLAVLIGARSGVLGVCWALLIRAIACFPALLIVNHRVFSLSPLRYLRTTFPSLFCGAIMFCCTFFLERYFYGDTFKNHVIALIFISAAGLAVYCACLCLFFKNEMNEVKSIIKQLVRK